MVPWLYIYLRQAAIALLSSPYNGILSGKTEQNSRERMRASWEVVGEVNRERWRVVMVDGRKWQLCSLNLVAGATPRLYSHSTLDYFMISEYFAVTLMPTTSDQLTKRQLEGIKSLSTLIETN